MTKTYNSPGISRFILLSILVFFVIYNITFSIMPYFTTGRIGVLLLLAWTFLERRNPFPLIKGKILLMFLPLPYVAIQYIVVGDFNQLSRLIHLFFYSYIAAAAFSCLSKDIKGALTILAFTAAAQSIFIFYSFFSTGFRTWISALTLTTSNIDFSSYIYRAPGLSGSSGASLSLIQSMGVFTGLTLLLDKSIERWRYSFAIACITLCAISCVMVGRTGILVSALLIAFFITTQKILSIKLAASILLAITFSFWLSSAMTSRLDDSFSMEFFTNWAFGFFTGKDETIKSISEMPIPPLSLETFYGTGLSSIVGWSNPSGHDSGFIQTYYSMGLPFSVIFYLAYLSSLFWITNWANLSLRLIIVALFFTLELKEPFIFKYSPFFILLTIYFINMRLKETTNNPSSSQPPSTHNF